MDGETRDIYRQARIGGRVLSGTHPAVLVVDFSCGFTDPACALGSDLADAVEATARLLGVARERGVLAVFTTIGFQPGGIDGGIWMRKMPAIAELQLDGPWTEVDPRLGRREDEPVIVKKGASAFFGTNLPAILAANRVDSVILCGATTSGCVRATAVDLLQYGYPTLVPRECVGDRAQAPHEANLFDIDMKYADVVSLEDAISFIEAEASATPVTPQR